jgi:hypothetical protein
MGETGVTLGWGSSMIIVVGIGDVIVAGGCTNS